MVVPRVVYRGKPGNNSWARWMVGRTMTKNQNNLISVIGKTGSGKTWSAISICEIMSKIDGVPFTIDNIVFSLTELMNLINSGTLKRGSKIIFDEPQISISARDFQSSANKVFNYLLSTFRHKNLTLFFCTPFESLLDKNTRKLFHMRFETVSVDSKAKTCRLKPRYLEYSDYKALPYRKQMNVIFKPNPNIKGYKVKKLMFWDVPMANKELIKEYEKKKTDFTNNLNKNISEKLKIFDDSGKSMTSTNVATSVNMNSAKSVNIPGVYRKPLTERQVMVAKAFAKFGNSLGSAKKVSELTGLRYGSISPIKRYIYSKGYTIDEFREQSQTL